MQSIYVFLYIGNSTRYHGSLCHFDKGVQFCEFSNVLFQDPFIIVCVDYIAGTWDPWDFRCQEQPLALWKIMTGMKASTDAEIIYRKRRIFV